MLLKATVVPKRQIVFLVLILTLFVFSSTYSLAETRIFFSSKGDATEEIIRQIEEAQDYIDIAMCSFTSEPIAEAIVRTKQRGKRT